jgi:hypothetical protein
MRHAIGDPRIPCIGEYGLIRNCLKGRCANKSGGGIGHDRLDTRYLCFEQQARQFNRFVGRNAARDAQYKALPGKRIGNEWVLWHGGEDWVDEEAMRR